MPMIRNILLFSAIVLAHSWVEDLSVVSKDGLQLGKSGYARGNGKLVETGDPAMLTREQSCAQIQPSMMLR